MSFQDGFTRYYKLAEEEERKNVYYNLGDYGLSTTNGVVIHVETPENGGNDDTGDGSVSAPFATLKRALKEIPENPPTITFFAYIKLGIGDFDLQGEYAGAIRGIRLIGTFIEVEDVNIISSSSLVSGKAATRQNTCDPFATSITTDGQYFITKNSNDTLSRTQTYVLRPSTSPYIQTPANITAGTAKIVQLGTRMIRTSSSSYIISPVTKVNYYNLDFIFTGSIDILSFQNCGWIYGCIIRARIGLFYGATENAIPSILSNNYYVNSQLEFRQMTSLAALQTSVLDNCQIYYESCSSINNFGNVYKNNSVNYNGFFGSVNNYPSTINFSSTDFENCSIPVRSKNPTSFVSFYGNVSLQNCSGLLQLENSSYAHRSIGTITGATTGVPIIVTSGQINNFKSGCDGTLTNSTTAGDEVTIGAAGNVSFSSLPKNDLSTGDSSTFSRAS